MKFFLKKVTDKLSRLIYALIPIQYRKEVENKNRLIYSLYREKQLRDCFEYFKDHLETSMIFKDQWKIREYSIKKSLFNDPGNNFFYLEFGTFEGKSANFFSKFVKKIYCFDSFEGLKEDWVGTPAAKGHFNLKKKIPKLNTNVETIVGWVEDTLDDFIKKHNPKINFVHLDMDIYSATKFTLESLKPYLTKNAVILFDELYNYTNWRQGEFRALQEVLKENEYKFIGFNIFGNQVAIQLNNSEK